MLAYTAGYAFGCAPHTDSADELLRAFEIRHALAFPAEGPFLGQAIHLGPFWFYLVALPLFMHASWLAAALFIGFVCSLQFPLAYWCGRRLVDARFGLLWAVALFFPGWASVQQLAFLNPNAVAAALLGFVALVLWVAREPAGAASFAAVGLAMAIVLHVHPTAMPVYLLALPLLSRARRRVSLAAAMAALALGFAIPFIPYLASQALHGFPDRGSATAYVGGQIGLAYIANAPLVLGRDLVDGPRLIAQHFLRWGPEASAALGWTFAALAAASVAAFIPRREFLPVRMRIAHFIAATALFSAWIAFLRPTTPVQFTWVLAPVTAALVATALWCLSRTRARVLAGVIAVAMVVVNLATIRALALAVRDGDGRMPASALDIKEPSPRVVTDIWFPAWAHAPLGRLLCSDARGVTVHGHLANIVDKDLGLDTLFACGSRDHVRLGGDNEGPHYTGMTRGFWRAWGAKPECWIGSMGIARATPRLQSRGIAIADGSTYLPRRGPTTAPTLVSFNVQSPPGAAVLVTNIVARYELFEVVRAEMNGEAKAPVAANELSQLFAAGNAPASWTFTVRTTYPGALDVVVVGGGAGSEAGAAAGAAGTGTGAGMAAGVTTGGAKGDSAACDAIHDAPAKHA